MATTQLQVSVYPTFLGEDEGINPIVLPEVFSSGGSLNLYIDELGRAKKILGYTQQNSTAVTQNGSGDASVNSGFASYFNGTTETLIGAWRDGVNEYEYWTSTDQGATWTYGSVDLGAAGGAISAVQYGNTLFLANTAGNRKYNGSSFSTVGGTQSPQPTAADSAGGNALNGTYKYKLVSVKADGVRSPGSLASTAVQVQNEAVSLSWSADADTNITGYELYRTTGTGNIYWFVTLIEGRTTVAYVDNTPDRIILENRALQEHGDAPPASQYCALHKDRVWWFAQPSSVSRGYFSDVGLPESVGANSLLDFTEPDGKPSNCTGGVGGYEGRLIVGTIAGIWTVSGTGAVIGGIVDYRKQRTNAQAGWVSSNTVVRIPDGALFRDENGVAQKTDKVTLAYLTPLGDIRIFDGDNDTVISNAVKGALVMTSNPALYQYYTAAHDELRGHVIWGFSTGGEYMNSFVVWNYRYGVWYVWNLNNSTAFGAWHVMAKGSQNQTILLGGYTNTGRCFKFWNGNNFNGAAIAAKWMSGTIYGRLGEDTFGRESPLPNLASTKRWRWVDLVLQSVSGVTLTVEWFNGQAGDSGTAIGSTTTQPSDSSLDSSQRRVLLHTPTADYLHDEGLRIRVSDSATTGSWALEGFALGFQVLQGLKRRNQ